MRTTFRHYNPEPLFGHDYELIRKFLVDIDNFNYPFGRFDWMLTHGYLDQSGLNKIGLWEIRDTLVGLATYDCQLGKAYLLTRPGFEKLKEDMLIQASTDLKSSDGFEVLIQDGDLHFQDIASKLGYNATQEKEQDSILPLEDANLDYVLPDGFSITSMKDRFDLYQYGRVLWRGFNHEANGQGPFILENSKNGPEGFLRPNVNLDLKIAVVSPNGNFVSYCGMWADEHSTSALVEPVATDPDYRKLGLGRACVLEACKRVKALGMTNTFVGSSQQFYYSIGFRPYASSTWWKQQ